MRILKNREKIENSVFAHRQGCNPTATELRNGNPFFFFTGPKYQTSELVKIKRTIASRQKQRCVAKDENSQLLPEYATETWILT
jgi:hypothetical protein